MRYLIDTNIIIDHLRGDRAATAFLEDIGRKGDRACISAITEYELLVYPSLTASQEDAIISFLGIFAVLNITSSIARTAARFRKTYRVDLVDALIAATAFKNKSALVTRNIKHFARIKEIRTTSI